MHKAVLAINHGGDNMRSRCENCKIRRKAESNPGSLIGIIWRLHTRICPGWKAYQKELASREQ